MFPLTLDLGCKIKISEHPRYAKYVRTCILFRATKNFAHITDSIHVILTIVGFTLDKLLTLVI